MNLISPNDHSNKIRLVIVNAIYYKGAWIKQFQKSNTKKSKFHTNGKDTVHVDMMQQEVNFLSIYSLSLTHFIS